MSPADPRRKSEPRPAAAPRAGQRARSGTDATILLAGGQSCAAYPASVAARRPLPRSRATRKETGGLATKQPSSTQSRPSAPASWCRSLRSRPTPMNSLCAYPTTRSSWLSEATVRRTFLSGGLPSTSARARRCDSSSRWSRATRCGTPPPGRRSPTCAAFATKSRTCTIEASPTIQQPDCPRTHLPRRWRRCSTARRVRH
jgi:hypothetical protein